tara:strand:- start:72 stop:326 length:255 start_codon:yes stop_codon:yes gene_type:complete
LEILDLVAVKDGLLVVAVVLLDLNKLILEKVVEKVDLMLEVVKVVWVIQTKVLVVMEPQTLVAVAVAGEDSLSMLEEMVDLESL